MIVVCKLHRLAQDGGKFKTNLIAKTLRTSVKIDEDYVAEFNKNSKVSGLVYEIDKEATTKRNAEIDGGNAPEVDRDELKAKADELGIEYPKNIKTDKLIELIENNG